MIANMSREELEALRQKKLDELYDTLEENKDWLVAGMPLDEETIAEGERL